nr:family 16 glycosylhydrolase [Bacteroidota bacterium]
DEFQGTTLDLKKWAFQTGDGCPSLCGWGNSELQYYTNSNNNIKIQNGNLIIEARQENQGSSKFTSGKIFTLGKFSQTYGRFEASIRLPKGRGLWPAFWMLPDNNDWPKTGEIDIMENRGDRPTITNGTLHYGSAWPNNQNDSQEQDAQQDLSNDFHLYAVEWSPSAIRWYFDDVLFKTETKNPNSLSPTSTDNLWPWNKNFHILLNLAVGGWFTGTTNATDVQLTKPTFEIDYVRVYDCSSSSSNQIPYGTNTINIPGRIEAEDFDHGCFSAFYDSDSLNQGHVYRYTPVDIQKCSDVGGGYNLGWITDQEWTKYTVNAVSGGLFDIQFRAASQSGGGQIRIEIDNSDVSGPVSIPSTGTWQNWTTITVKNINVTAGNHVIRIYIIKGGFNWNYMEFNSTITMVKSNNPDSWKPTVRMAEEGLMIENADKIKSIELFDLLGKRHIMNFTLQGSNYLPTNALSSGVYIIRLINYKDEVQVIKFIK